MKEELFEKLKTFLLFMAVWIGLSISLYYWVMKDIAETIGRIYFELTL